MNLRFLLRVCVPEERTRVKRWGYGNALHFVDMFDLQLVWLIAFAALGIWRPELRPSTRFP